ncbi:response regulator transcription factor [Vibrio aerogenes]|uniref:response regulator transcription factor n=1 Tax=Vibrio aerogenes TaxID=92172 RepID=UPI00093769F7|nr:DNA-binding response regulator [Vibrio aerogenes]
MQLTLTTSEDLIEQIVRIAPDMIFVDSTLGKIHHIRETCLLLQKQMNGRHIALPPVLSIIEGNSGQRGEVLNDGAIDCVNYPFNPREVIMRVEYTLLIVAACQQGIAPERVSAPLYYGGADRSKYNYLASQTADYLEKNLASHMTLAQLAQRVNSNRNSLSEAFKQAFGCTIFQWLYHRRMEKAAEYLSRTHLDVQQVAYRVGYIDANNFSTAFKKNSTVHPVYFVCKMKNPDRIEAVNCPDIHKKLRSCVAFS